MRALHHKAHYPLVIVALCAVIVIAVGGCGGGSDESTAGGSGSTAQSGSETPADARAAGMRQCSLPINTKKSLSQLFQSNDPVVLAADYSQQIYVGDFPQAAGKGCLAALKAEK
jgi:hypothetical protein